MNSTRRNLGNLMWPLIEECPSHEQIWKPSRLLWRSPQGWSARGFRMLQRMTNGLSASNMDDVRIITAHISSSIYSCFSLLHRPTCPHFTMLIRRKFCSTWDSYWQGNVQVHDQVVNNMIGNTKKPKLIIRRKPWILDKIFSMRCYRLVSSDMHKHIEL